MTNRESIAISILTSLTNIAGYDDATKKIVMVDPDEAAAKAVAYTDALIKALEVKNDSAPVAQ